LIEPVHLLVRGPVRFVGDLDRTLRTHGGLAQHLSAVLRWVMPVGMGLVFVALFAAANPLIEGLVTRIDLWAALDAIFNGRALVWLLVAAGVWGLVAVRGTAARAPAPKVALQAVEAGLGAEIFGGGAILRALVLFNLLFAVQTLSDVAYLWSGAQLPAGMSYATYAHRGAYPLMVTAALAAVFVVLAFGPGSCLEKSTAARVLVFAWIGQTVMLVVSSILRLALYVDIYALSYWRVAAFIWMALVGVGLIAILSRILLGRSNEWLVGVNAAAVLVVLYVCCFIDFAGLIASYNVAHSREVSGRGVALDRVYTASLGPQAIPAIDTYLRHVGAPDSPRGVAPLDCKSNWMANDMLVLTSNWKAWSWRRARLVEYLRNGSRIVLC
jgi:hypothetical protein